MSKDCFKCDGSGWEWVNDGWGDIAPDLCFYCDGRGYNNDEHKNDDTGDGNANGRSKRQVCATCLSGSLQ